MEGGKVGDVVEITNLFRETCLGLIVSFDGSKICEVKSFGRSYGRYFHVSWLVSKSRSEE